MADIILGRIDRATVIVQDVDGDDTLDAGESLVLTGPDADRFTVSEALDRLGLSSQRASYVRPLFATRLSTIEAYTHCLREAVRRHAEGNILAAADQLLLAQRLAEEGNIPSSEGFDCFLWTCISLMPDLHGLTEEELIQLRDLDSPGSRNAALVLEYLSCRERLRPGASLYPYDRRGAEERATEVRREIAARLELPDSLRDYEAVSFGRHFRVGDRVRENRTGTIFTVTGFVYEGPNPIIRCEEESAISRPGPRERRFRMGEVTLALPLATGRSTGNVGPEDNSVWDGVREGVRLFFGLGEG